MNTTFVNETRKGGLMFTYSSLYDPQWISRFIETYWKDAVPECVFFWHIYEDNGVFSNWYDSPFVIDNIRYNHVEQYIMAEKARVFNDTESYDAILKAVTPKECKNLGRLVAGFDEKIWNDVRCDVLRKGLYAKFTQNEDMKQALLATGDSILAESSPYDEIFGIKLRAEEAITMSPLDWQGDNLLGKALMELRADLRSNV